MKRDTVSHPNSYSTPFLWILSFPLHRWIDCTAVYSISSFWQEQKKHTARHRKSHAVPRNKAHSLIWHSNVLWSCRPLNSSRTDSHLSPSLPLSKTTALSSTVLGNRILSSWHWINACLNVEISVWVFFLWRGSRAELAIPIFYAVCQGLLEREGEHPKAGNVLALLRWHTSFCS